ncbi:maleylpyruvate isomerase N-terminal domain-containing protein [Actinomycetospora aeridis]|uniref:Maleylpyruvate isomerase N-terminal domain-containing protein n=1 Tax=Actinomycetospora aeridis TaxID=3129231 RepID=A0ABU8MZZ3_9PSEU
MPPTTPGDDVAYRTVRKAVAEIVTTGDVAARPVPSCPEWTGRDLVGHLVDIACRVSARCGRPVEPGVVAGVGTVEDDLAVWETVGARLDPLIAGGGAEVMVMDAFTHELDLHRSAGTAPERGHPAFATSLGVLVAGVGGEIRERGLPALRVRAGGSQWIAGDGEPAATVTGADYDVHRAFAGRRSLDQVRGLDWSTDPDAWLPAFRWKAFHPPARPVESATPHWRL